MRDLAPERGEFEAVKRHTREARIGSIDGLPPRGTHAIEDSSEGDTDRFLRAEFVQGTAIAHVAIRDLIDVAAAHDALLAAGDLAGAD